MTENPITYCYRHTVIEDSSWCKVQGQSPVKLSAAGYCIQYSIVGLSASASSAAVLQLCDCATPTPLLALLEIVKVVNVKVCGMQHQQVWLVRGSLDVKLPVTLQIP